VKYSSDSVLSYSVNGDALCHAHQQLTSSSDSVQQFRSNIASRLWSASFLKRSLLILLLNELDSGQQIAYLERCWTADSSKTAKPASFWRSVWRLLR
jgi:hypothetical protein